MTEKALHRHFFREFCISCEQNKVQAIATAPECRRKAFFRICTALDVKMSTVILKIEEELQKTK